MKLKGNNKGISLIELTIAVCMMSILVVPIVFQLISSVRSNTRSKERQKVTEASDYVLEYFQKEDKLKLDSCTSTDPGIVINSMDHASPTCALYDSSFNALGISVTYDVYDYDLNNTTLGVDKATYKRGVSIDNLSNKVMAAKRQINFGISNTTATSKGFELTQDNKCVKYDSNNHIVALVVEDAEKPLDYIEPGKSDSGYIQDLDSDTMAIIEAGVNNIDKQFALDVLATCIKNISLKKDDYITRNGEEAWDKLTGYIQDGADDSTQLNQKLKEILRSGKRYIEINVSTITAKAKYKVTCTVYYEAKIKGIRDFSNHVVVPESTATYNYKVFDKEFNTSTPPDVYYVYEPLTDTTISMSSYVKDDYIIVHADTGASGCSIKSLLAASGKSVNEIASFAASKGIEYLTPEELARYASGEKYVPVKTFEMLRNEMRDAGLVTEASLNAMGATLVDASKIYLIKPQVTSQQASTVGNSYRYFSGNNYDKYVKIHINQELDSTVNDHMLDIYTNIYTTVDDRVEGKKLFEAGDFEDAYHSIDNTGKKVGYYGSSMEQFNYSDKIFSTTEDLNAVGIGGASTTVAPYAKNRIHPLAKTSNFVDTLYTITVNLTEDVADNPKSYSFVAGKGAN
ncbi:MAG: hypothetical protein IKQ71_08780 [Lachnospiraceae bacterium]|nr:hypothetical protein [Lachnospiraceae bacterium]